MVKVGKEPYSGIELGFWEKWEDAVLCAERYMKNYTDDISWTKKGEDSWYCGCNWILIYKIKKELDLF